MSEQRRRSDWPPAFGRLDRMFEEWFRSHPMRRSSDSVWGGAVEETVRLDEYRDGNTIVLRAELPGIDPERDVQITVADGMLQIAAERRVEEGTEDRDYARRELRYGRFGRTLPMPESVHEAGIAATYRDGILEIRVPLAESPPSEPTRINVSRG
jgi:HSP20 family protein